MEQILFDREYFLQKKNAATLINIVNFLRDNNFDEENLDDTEYVRIVLRETIRAFARREPTTAEVDAFRNTIREFTVDYLKSVNLYRINQGVLLVAVVEFHLNPRTDSDEKHATIYDCSHSRAAKLYKKLHGLPDDYKLDLTSVAAARSFFKCDVFLRESGCLETIRAYLRDVELDSAELQYVGQRTREIIESTDVIVRMPVDDGLARASSRRSRKFINREYFHDKANAHLIVNLVNYLNDKKIDEAALENTCTLSAILRQGMGIYQYTRPASRFFSALRKTIVNFGLDYLKAVNLYRINRGVLAVACIELHLYPGATEPEYFRIYRCSSLMAASLYNKLMGYPENNKPSGSRIRAAEYFFRHEHFTMSFRFLDKVRSYLKSIDIDEEEMSYIKQRSIELLGG